MISIIIMFDGRGLLVSGGWSGPPGNPILLVLFCGEDIVGVFFNISLRSFSVHLLLYIPGFIYMKKYALLH
jgi:hypothetical protein